MLTSGILWLLVFAAGGRVVRFITADKLFDPVRTRWQEHFVQRSTETLIEADPSIVVAGALDPIRAGQLRRKVVEELAPSDPFWRKVARRLARLEIYMSFLSCPWCVGIWVYLVATLSTWALVLGFAGTVLGLPAWFVLPALTLAFSWLYCLIVNLVD